MSEFFAGLWSSLLRVNIMDGPVPLRRCTHSPSWVW